LGLKSTGCKGCSSAGPSRGRPRRARRCVCFFWGGGVLGGVWLGVGGEKQRAKRGQETCSRCQQQKCAPQLQDA
jgi:hypothetical protein